MGWLFRKRIKIAKGVYINLGKKGASVSVGGRGASMTFGKNGKSTNVGIPGTGLSFRHKFKNDPKSQDLLEQDLLETEEQPKKKKYETWEIIYGLCLIAIFVYLVMR